jgi:hypothetical protein
MPKFQDQATWQRADQLMQPALIRVVANVEKWLEQSNWRGHYEDVVVWEAGVSAATQARVMDLRSQLATADPETGDRLRQELARLPSPYPGYQLCLQPGPAPSSVGIQGSATLTLEATPNQAGGIQDQSRDQHQSSDEIKIELWDLCYQICFRNYDSATGTSWTRGFGQGKSQGVEIDTTLFKDNGDIDWTVLDQRAQQVIERIFVNLS